MSHALASLYRTAGGGILEGAAFLPYVSGTQELGANNY